MFVLQDANEAVELANEALEMKPESYEAYYARAKAKLDLKLYESSLQDVKEAVKLAPTHNAEVRKVLIYLQEDIVNKMSSTGRISNHRDLAVSVDTLHE